MKPLVEFYDSLLASLSCHIDEDSREVSTHYAGEYAPAYVKKKQLIAINQKIVRDGFGEDERKIAFHPLSESTAASSLSDVHQWLLIAIRVRLNTLFAMAASRVLTIALSPEIQSKMKPSEIAQYKGLTEIDQKTLQTLTNIIDNIDVTNSTRSFVHMRVKRNGQLGGKSFGRVAYITFPILSELKDATDTVFDVKVRKKDLASLRILFEEVLLNGKGDELSDFSAANTTMVAPALSAMLTAYYNVLIRLNSLAKAHGKTMEPAGLPVDVSWFPAISDFDRLRAMVPPLDGNTGTAPKEESDIITFKEDTSYNESHSTVTGINDAVEIKKEKPMSEERHSFLKALAVGGAMTATTPKVNDPLALNSQMEVNTETMSPEEYAVWRVQNQAYQNMNGPQNQAFLRGRDAFLQQNQAGYNVPLNTGYQNQWGAPMHQTQPMVNTDMSGMRVIGQTTNGQQLVELPDGRVVTMSVVAGAPTPTHQTMPSGGTARFSAFAKG